MAKTQTVLWARVLARLDGPGWCELDPRRTKVAERADVHLTSATGPTCADGCAGGYVDVAFGDSESAGFGFGDLEPQK